MYFLQRFLLTSWPLGPLGFSLVFCTFFSFKLPGVTNIPLFGLKISYFVGHWSQFLEELGS